MDKLPEAGYTPANLRHIRAQHGLTQSEVGRRTGTALRTVQNWEADVHTPDHSGMPHRKWVRLLESLNKTKEKEFTNLTADNNEEYWADIPYQIDKFDYVSLPDAVVSVMVEQNVGIMAAWRIHSGMTLEQAAGKAGMTPMELLNIEQSNKPHTKIRQQFAEIYSCRPEQLAV